MKKPSNRRAIRDDFCLVRWQHRFLAESPEMQRATRFQTTVSRRAYHEFNVWLLRTGKRLNVCQVTPAAIDEFATELVRRGGEVDFVWRAEHALLKLAAWLSTRDSTELSSSTTSR